MRGFLVVVTCCVLAAGQALADDWRPHNINDHLRGQIGAGATAKGEISDKFGTHPAELTAYCADNSTVVVVESSSMIVVGAVTVSWTVNGGPVQRASWEVCKSNNCVGLWNGAGIPFLKSLFDKALLRMVISRRYGEDIAADFAVVGANQALQAAGEKCGWLPKAEVNKK